MNPKLGGFASVRVLDHSRKFFSHSNHPAKQGGFPRFRLCAGYVCEVIRSFVAYTFSDEIDITSVSISS